MIKIEYIGSRNTKIAKITIEDRCYDSKKECRELTNMPFELFHNPTGWIIQLSDDGKIFQLQINGVKF